MKRPGVVLWILFLFFPAGMLAQISGEKILPYPASDLTQTLRNLEGGTRILAVCMRPGDEDLRMLALERKVRGATITTVYATNGESIPAPGSAIDADLIAGTRKQEAWDVMQSLGCRAFFLNLDDPGVMNSPASLDSLWIDGFKSGLAQAIRAARPHFVLLMLNGHLNTGPSDAWRSLWVQAANQAANFAESNRSIQTTAEGMSITPWTVQRIWSDFGEKGMPRSITVEKAGMERLDIAARQSAILRTQYHSLTESPVEDRTSDDRTYVPEGFSLLPRQTFVDEGISVISNQYESLHRLVQSISGPLSRTKRLDLTIAALDSVDRILSTRLMRMSELDKETFVGWKMNLEPLRVRLLNVRLEVAVSDSILAPRQLLFVKVKTVDKSFKDDTTYIAFSPRPSKGWSVNEHFKMMLPLTEPQNFRILTGEELLLDYPTTARGMLLHSFDGRLQFVIFHRGKTPRKTFVAYYDLPLRYARARSVQITTPVLVWGRDPFLGYRAFSSSRDPRKGMFKIEDSVCTASPHIFETTGKDAMLDDTMALTWGRKPKQDTTLVKILTVEKAEGDVPVVLLHVQGDTSMRLVLVTTRRHGPIERALTRLGMTGLSVCSPDSLQLLDGTDAVVIDRDALTGSAGNRVSEVLGTWVRKGGRVVVFPQEPGTNQLTSCFRAGSFTPAGDPVTKERSAADALHRPYEIPASCWDGWKYARMWSGLSTEQFSSEQISIPFRVGKEPGLASVRLGNGTLTLIALNLEQQLDHLHEGSFKILANLLARSSP